MGEKRTSRRTTLVKYNNNTTTTCLEEEREERDSERVAPSVTGRCCVITSRVSPSLLSADWRDVVVSSVSPVDLRGDQRCPQGVLGERHQRCRHLHRARQEEDRHRHGRCLRPQETGKDSLRFRRLNTSNNRRSGSSRPERNET